VKDISIAEAAMLAGLPKAPSAFNPVANPKRARARQLHIIDRMEENGFITPAQALAAKKLVAMGYDDLSAFAGMNAFKAGGATPMPLDAVNALKQVMRSPKPTDLPKPTSLSTERLFQSTLVEEKKSYGSPVRISKSVLVKPVSERVTPNPIPPTRVVTAAEVLAANVAFWTRNPA